MLTVILMLNFNYSIQHCVPTKAMVAGQELRGKIPLPFLTKAIIKGNGIISHTHTESHQSSFPERDSKETRKCNNIVLLQFQDYSLLKE